MRRFQFSIAAMMFFVVYAAMGFAIINNTGIRDEEIADDWENASPLLLYFVFAFLELFILAYFFARSIPIIARPDSTNVFWAGSFVGAILSRGLIWSMIAYDNVVTFILFHPGAIVQAILMGFFVQWVYCRSVYEPEESSSHVNLGSSS